MTNHCIINSIPQLFKSIVTYTVYPISYLFTNNYRTNSHYFGNLTYVYLTFSSLKDMRYRIIKMTPHFNTVFV